MGLPIAWLADDSAASRRLLEAALRKSGWDVRAFESGLELANAFPTPTTSPSLILLDMEMPELDGFCTAKMLRKAGYLNSLALCSGTDTEAIRAGAHRCGFDHVLPKSAGLKTLCAELVRIRMLSASPAAAPTPKSTPEH